MMIVDTPGFQNPEQGGSARGASFEELCHNYAQDRLQRLFHERTFVQELERYKEENIELAFDDLEPPTDDSVAAVDQASHQSLVRSLARTDEARGLLWLLEEEALVPGASEDALLERLFSYYGPQEGDKKGQSPLLRSSKPHHFLLGHSHGTNWVEYNVIGWLNYTKQNPATQNAPRLLQDSQKKIISNLFLGRAGSATVLSGSIAGLEGGSQLALRRATSMRKTFTTGMAAVKKKSLCIQIKLQVDALIDTIKKSKLHFVHCFLPVAEGWAGEPRSASSRRVSSSSELDLPSGDHCEAGLLQLDVPLLRTQLRGSRLLDAIRMYRQELACLAQPPAWDPWAEPTAPSFLHFFSILQSPCHLLSLPYSVPFNPHPCSTPLLVICPEPPISPCPQFEQLNFAHSSKPGGLLEPSAQPASTTGFPPPAVSSPSVTLHWLPLHSSSGCWGVLGAGSVDRPGSGPLSLGYPDHMVFSEFRRRFDVLAPHLTKKHGRNYIVVDERRAVEELLECLDLEKSSCCMGLSRGLSQGPLTLVFPSRFLPLKQAELLLAAIGDGTSSSLCLGKARCGGAQLVPHMPALQPPNLYDRSFGWANPRPPHWLLHEKVFFRAGTLARLEEQRDEQTSRNLTLFQAACRGYLARQHFKKRKIQDLAIRCVQKNIKKNKGVKDWPWWKLFTTVRPLIEVQLSEEQIRNKDEEIQQLRSKLEKVEKERNELRLNSDRLETRISELTSELTDERNTGESASQLLDTETAERLRAEKEMKELQTQYDALKKQMEVMEMEVMEARLIRAAEINGEVDDDDAGGEWRLKYERAVREVDFTKKRLQQEFEDKLEVEQQNKRQLERRFGDLQADSEESQRALQQLKKKCQRLTAELQDTKLHLEGQQVRNHELEKKQRRFDSELSQVHEEAQREKLQREKLQREKDMLLAEAFSLKQQLEEKDMDIAGFTQKVVSLEAELQDISSQESKDEASLAKVKKQLRDLEAKVKDQEEELDEQAGTIQMLEQVQESLAKGEVRCSGAATIPTASPRHGPEDPALIHSRVHLLTYSQNVE
ncbi:Unconventional myosin-XVIIIa [Saguinus oedipus]|uniref:Unconventional myosin-XVIIIa n=1 Tax=Saguinus oedipus TaxID=9490 RepID=A0ABQ9VQ31_SAGOE|nr:Unconventional myosin-XVIIIa [Saguinus oedipus]